MARAYRDARALAKEFRVPVSADIRPGLDWLIWLFPAQEAVLRILDSPKLIRQLLAHIGETHRRRVPPRLAVGKPGGV